jgi:hypothetical protein
MRLVVSNHHVRAKHNKCRNTSAIVNETQLGEFQATEEELAGSENELSEVEALLLHPNERKLLLVERIGRLNDTIQMKKTVSIAGSAQLNQLLI